MNELDIVPSQDGLRHIRIGVNGMTKLGKLLANTAHLSFHVLGHSGEFRTMENWWVYVRGGCKNHTVCQASASQLPKMALRTLINPYPPKDFRRLIMQGVRSKIEQNPELEDLLVMSKSLPFVRYNIERTNYGPEVVLITDQPWFIRELTLIRKGLLHERATATA
ncbi:MAG TPA: hypothetical protein VN081_06620 [Dongiaceae bacterium]|nr:hypothetical protein [Dongiaceae bacterium]